MWATCREYPVSVYIYTRNISFMTSGIYSMNESELFTSNVPYTGIALNRYFIRTLHYTLLCLSAMNITYSYITRVFGPIKYKCNVLWDYCHLMMFSSQIKATYVFIFVSHGKSINDIDIDYIDYSNYIKGFKNARRLKQVIHGRSFVISWVSVTTISKWPHHRHWSPHISWKWQKQCLFAVKDKHLCAVYANVRLVISMYSVNIGLHVSCTFPGRSPLQTDLWCQ